ncbi:uncharacterized protein ACJ7VT_021488 [Polymixia lowei]
MFQLREFVSERLSAAAAEIFGEFEKTIALYQGEVTRSRDEVDHLRRQLDLFRVKAAADQREDNSTVVAEECIPNLEQENQGPKTPVKTEESHCGLELEVQRASQTNVDLMNRDSHCYVIKTDLEISETKEEQMEFTIDSRELEVVILPPNIVKSDKDQPDTQSTNESPPQPPGCSAAQNKSSAQDCIKVKGRQASKQGLASSNEDSSTKIQNDRSFCHLCGKSFQYIGSLMKHIHMHDNKVINCGACRKSYRSTKELLSHLQCAHSKTHFCNVCGKTFSKLQALKLHSKMHAGKRQHTCQECGKAFLQKGHLIEHIRTHFGDKLFNCDICGKLFSESQDLTVHKRAHKCQRGLVVTSSTLAITSKYT